jgi:hypothetical protein
MRSRIRRESPLRFGGAAQNPLGCRGRVPPRCWLRLTRRLASSAFAARTVRQRAGCGSPGRPRSRRCGPWRGLRGCEGYEYLPFRRLALQFEAPCRCRSPLADCWLPAALVADRPFALSCSSHFLPTLFPFGFHTLQTRVPEGLEEP